MNRSEHYWGDAGHPGSDYHGNLADDPECGPGRDDFDRMGPGMNAVTPYLVDSSGNAPYRTLHDAMCAALRDCKGSSRPPTVMLRPGTYYLTDVFNSRRPVNIVGTSFNSEQSPVVKGCTESGGSKSWNGVRFKGSKSHYIVNNRKSCDIATDMFCKCQFTDNFKLTTYNDRAVFDSCHFNYDSLDRDRVLEVADGNGHMEFHKSKFDFCRTGSSCAKSFIFLGSNSCDTKTLFNCNVFQGSVEGKDTFSMIRPWGNQPIHFMFGYVNVTKAQGKTYVFGAPTKTIGITLCVKSSAFFGAEHCSNIAVTGNIWPKLVSNEPMIFHANKIHLMRSMWYGDTKCNGRPENKPMQKCSSDGSFPKKEKCACDDGCGSIRIQVYDDDSDDDQECTVPDADTGDRRFQWVHNQIIPSLAQNFVFKKMEKNGFVRLDMVSNHIFAPNNHKKELFLFEQDDLGGEIEIHSHSNTYRNDNPDVDPNWLLTNLDNTAIPQNSTTIEGLDVAMMVGGGVISAPPLSTTLI